ncbi:MAG: EVE domain-containing protein [Candidatus Sericytochromatia bacterium]
MREQENNKFWIIVASKDHVNIGIKGGFVQANHGKKEPMKRLKKGDKIIFYSSKENIDDKYPYQKFTAICEVNDDEPYIGIMEQSNFNPYRRNVDFYPSIELSIKNVIEDLDFIKNKQKWGFPFMKGFFEISEKDFKYIESKMKDK